MDFSDCKYFKLKLTNTIGAADMDDLAKVLKALQDKPASLQAAVELLEREAPTPQARGQHSQTNEHGK